MIGEILSRNEYLEAPCRKSSIPYWKAQTVAQPENMLILHENEYSDELLTEYEGDTYFRLLCRLDEAKEPCIPMGFSLVSVSEDELAVHISDCYPGMKLTGAELEAWKARRVYRPDLWIAVADERTGRIAASGIAELDEETGEGMLEWIQTAEQYRRRGLGAYIVRELLWRMRGQADFVTVSGRIKNETHPERLYRSCGFCGEDIWHILRKRG